MLKEFKEFLEKNRSLAKIKTMHDNVFYINDKPFVELKRIVREELLYEPEV